MAAQTLMLQGTGSDVGKSILTAGLCRILANKGYSVSPFKPQNMSNNAAVTKEGGEIGRAQWLQARAARVEPSVHMNPVLLKPQTDIGAQVVVQGRMTRHAAACGYQLFKETLLPKVFESFDVVLSDNQYVIIEGAGSPAEVNLRANDIANMGFALPRKVPIVLVADIDRGGVIATLVGTYALLPPEERVLVAGFIINKFRGDVSLFANGISIVEKETGWPCFGVLPFLPCVKRLPAEDAVILEKPIAPNEKTIHIAVPMLSRIANFDDLDPLRAEPNVSVDFCRPGKPLPSSADLIIIPGTKSTLSDLQFLKEQGWDIDIAAHVRQKKPVLGLCGGYQILGKLISDPLGIEGPPEQAQGLGLLDVETLLASEKSVTEVSGYTIDGVIPVSGYEIHVGKTTGADCDRPLFTVDGRSVGAQSIDGLVQGCYLHGIFNADSFRESYLNNLRSGSAGRIQFESEVDSALNELAGAMMQHLDIEAMIAIAREV